MKQPSNTNALRPLAFFVTLEFVALLIGLIGLGMRNGPIAGLAILGMFAGLVYAGVWGCKSINALAHLRK